MQTVQTEQVRAELIAHAPDGVAPGKTVWVGLQIAHQPHWHTYWKNPGDSGLATQLQWTLPQGITAGDIAWPTPQKIAIGTLANFGYEGTVLLPVPLTITQAFAPPGATSIDIRLNASWLVCRQECVPQEGTFVLSLPIKGSTVLHSAVFEAARQASPQPFGGTAQVQITSNGLNLSASGLPAAWHGKALNAFPETPEVIEPATAPSTRDKVKTGLAQQHGTQAWQDGVWTAQIALSPLRSTAPTAIPFVLALGKQSWLAPAQVQGTWPAAGTPALPVTRAALTRP